MKNNLIILLLLSIMFQRSHPCCVIWITLFCRQLILHYIVAPILFLYQWTFMVFPSWEILRNAITSILELWLLGSGFTPDSPLRNNFWQTQGTIWDAKDLNQVEHPYYLALKRHCKTHNFVRLSFVIFVSFVIFLNIDSAK